MDNLTHTLAGVLIGEAVSRLAPQARAGLPPPQRRDLLVALSAVCSNLPDADLLYTFAAGTKLGYLSQHRGYTHTIVGIALAAALAILVVELVMRWRGQRPARQDHGAILAAAGLSVAVHLVLDFTNNYGVHPFWPVDNRWVYGDAVFIIEPLLWVCAAPLLFLQRTFIARGLLAAVLIAAVALSFGTRWMLPASGAGLSVLLASLLYAGWKGSARTALTCAAGAWLAVTAMFFVASGLAGDRIAREVAARHPGASLLDRVLTPLPANPLCWNVIVVTLEAGQYALRRAVVSVGPAVLAARDCPDRTLDEAATAPMRPIAAQPGAAVRWLDEYVVGKAEFPRIVQAYCEAAVFMHFARAPWLASRDGRWIVGDLRYDREPQLGFAEVELAEPSRACSGARPPWIEPRRDVLAPAR